MIALQCLYYVVDLTVATGCTHSFDNFYVPTPHMLLMLWIAPGKLQIKMESPQETIDQKSVKISEAPNSKDHLDALFEVLVSPQDQPKKTLGKPMNQRELPDSFFNASTPGVRNEKPSGIRLGPRINVGPSTGQGEHLRSISMPAKMDHGHQYSSDNVLVPLPAGWEDAKTPDGLSYFIE